MEDFDLLYMLKTPLFMGSASKVIQEAEQVEVNQDDHVNLTLKNLFIVRALTVDANFEQLKSFLQSLMTEGNP
jgi:hypothetical protein